MVLDSHVLVWWLSETKLLSRNARKAIAAAEEASSLVVSAISVFEIVTAVRRGRLQFTRTTDSWLADAFSLPQLRFQPISTEIARIAADFGEEMHGDPADRIIAATAFVLGAPLITADAKLRVCPAVKTIW